MLSFRSILVAAAMFATIASAIPTPDVSGSLNGVSVAVAGFSGSLSGAAGGLGGLRRSHEDVAAAPDSQPTKRILGLNLGHILHGLDPRGVAPATPAGLPTKRRQPSSPGDIFKTCSDGVELVVVKIEAAVNVEGGAKNVDHGLVIDLLGEIVDLLKDALEELKVIVVALLTLNGVACTIAELAGVVAGLLILVIKVVWLVLSTVGFLDVTLCGVIASIGILLCELLDVVLALVVELKVELLVLIKPFIDQCNYNHFGQILVLLGILI